MNRAAARVVRRVKAYVKNRTDHGWRSVCQHVIVSPGKDEWWGVVPHGTNLKHSIWERLRAVLHEVGIKGGAVVYHHERVPTKYNDRFDIETDSPHFHIIAFGKINPNAVRSLFDRCGTIVKGMGRPTSLMSIAQYILSHAAVPFNPALRQSSYHTVTWFGCVSYSKFRVPVDFDADFVYCPGCKTSYPLREWVYLDWKGSIPPPDKRWGPLQGNQWAAVTLDRTGGMDCWERHIDYI